MDYDLDFSKGRAFTAPTAHDVLYNVGDFIQDGEHTLLSINLSYNLDEGDVTAFVLYE